jgi:hypothetical protein
MKRALIMIALAAGLSAGPAVSAWDPGGFLQTQAQKGRPGGPPPEPAERGRDTRQERPDERRGRMTEDERRGLQRDLDKANREIYGGRQQKQ